MPTTTGTTGPLTARTTRRFVHGQGWSIVEERTGTAAAVSGQILSFKQLGYDVRVDGDGPVRTLTATKQAISESDDQDFYDRFTMHKETLQKSIWQLDDVQTEGALYAATTGTNFQEYRKTIEDAVKDCDSSQLASAVTYPVSHQVFRELGRGTEDYEDEYTVLTRERVVGINYAQKLQLRNGNISTIYTQSELQSVFSIPNFIGINWPNTTGTTPEQTQWGWRSRKQEVDFIDSSKVQVVQDWAWAAWSTLLYSTYS